MKAIKRWNLSNSKVVLLFAILVLLTSSAIVILPTFPYSYDDAYITYRYAHNLATGSGFVYHPGETQLATTAPVFAIFLGVISIPFPHLIPIISGWISGLSLFAASLAIYLFARRRGQDLVGLIAGIAFVFSPILMEMFGGEIIPMFALILWAYLAYDEEKFFLTGLLFGVAVGFRADAIIPMGLVSAHFLISRRRIPWWLIIGFAIPYGSWSLYAFSRYGSILPDTLGAKVAQGQSGMWPNMVQGSLHVFRMYLGENLFTGPAAHPIFRIYLFLMIPGLIAMFMRSKYWLLPLTAAGLQLIGYIVLGVPFYHWYIAPGLFGAAVLLGCIVGQIPQVISYVVNKLIPPLSLNLSKIGLLVALGIVLPMFVEGAKFPLRKGLAIHNSYPAVPYRAVGEWLAQNTPEDSTIGYVEIGYIGFYSMRSIVDPLGLVTQDAIDHVRERDITWAYRDKLPNYLVVNPRFTLMFGSFQQEPWFTSCYKELSSFEELKIYERCSHILKEDIIFLEQTQVKNDIPAGELLASRPIGQTFLAQSNALRSIGVLLATYDRDLEGPLLFHLQEWNDAGNSIDLVTIEMDLSEIQNNAWRLFTFAPIENSLGKTYYFFFEAPESQEGQAITVWSTKDDTYSGGALIVNHTPENGDLSFMVYYVKE